MASLRVVRKVASERAGHRIEMARERGGKLRHPKGAGHRMASALEQLRGGVPLNWTQIEDDRELQTLARLQPLAQKWRAERWMELPPTLKAEIYGDIAPLLPAPRKVEPAAPRSLAGYSPGVAVGTQVEDVLPGLASSIPRWIAATLGACAVLILAAWAINNYVATANIPNYKWLQVTAGRDVIIPWHLPAGWREPSCRGYAFMDSGAKREFTPVGGRRAAQQAIGFPIDFLPGVISAPITYTLNATSYSLAPCVVDVANAGDPGGTVLVNYISRRNGGTGFGDIAYVYMFQVKARPTSLDAAAGTWKPVRIGPAQGIYWRGTKFRDLAGNVWNGDTNVLMFERDDIVTTIIGNPSQGAGEAFLLGILGAIERERAAASGKDATDFNWIEVTDRSKPIGTAQKQAANRTQVACATPASSNGERAGGRFRTVKEPFKKYLGYQAASLPATATLLVAFQAQPVGTPGPTEQLTQKVEYNISLVSAAVLACSGGQLIEKDPGAQARVQYSANAAGTVGDLPRARRNASVVLFEAQRSVFSIDVTGARWRRIEANGGRGIAVTGGTFLDPAGIDWPERSSIVLAEKGDSAVIIATSNGGEDLLVALAAALDWGGGSNDPALNQQPPVLKR